MRICGRWLLGGFVGLSLACGLRTDPLDNEFVAVTDGNVDAGMEGDVGTCSMPIELPQTNSSGTGRLAGAGLYSGVCGVDDGAEDVYRFVPASNTDVTIAFDPAATEIEPTLRVLMNACTPEDGDPILCDGSVFDGALADPRHFFAQQGNEYFIVVDSAAEADGAYAFDLTLGAPSLSQCDVHPEVIEQIPGSIFMWSNDFSAGFGRVDSACGGAGKENVFRLEAIQPGTVTVTATGSGGFSPLVSIRTGCGASTEVTCETGSPASTQFGIPGAGTYYIVVDDLTPDGGAYNLEVRFD